MSVIFVVTNHGDMGTTGKKTGWYLPEVAHPYHVFKENGIKMVIASPKGGFAPMDPSSHEAFGKEEICANFLKDEEAQKAIKNTVAIKDLKLSDYKVIFYAGGHGPMWDMPDSKDSNEAATKIYEADGIVAAVCHGTVGLLNTKLSSGKWLVDGHELTCFTNSEENAVNLMEAMPFALETELVKHGATFKDGGDWQNNVVTSGRVVTGQNPQSATDLGKAIVEKMKELKYL